MVPAGQAATGKAGGDPISPVTETNRDLGTSLDLETNRGSEISRADRMADQGEERKSSGPAMGSRFSPQDQAARSLSANIKSQKRTPLPLNVACFQ